MCGIAGFYSKNKKYNSPEIVSAMLDRMSYRGPDQKGIREFERFALGMLRLSIIDTHEDLIPYSDNTQRYAIAYNGEIYNHEDIRARLKTKYHFDTTSDAETVLYSFIDEGIQSIAEFNGMYAFALYDSEKDTLYIVRDKTGEKPLYYSEGKDFFVFASEMKSLLHMVDAVYNEDALSYQAYEFTVGRETLFKDIYALEPGEYLKVENGRVSIHNYWKIWENIIEIEDNEKKIFRDLSELVEDAILLRTKNCAHQYATFVSGGVDSALVACIAKPDFLYTAHYDYSDFDELDYAKLVSTQLKKELHIVTPSKEDFLKTRKEIAFHLDTPCTWTSFTLWMLLERSKRDGVKVYLSGDGADEIFAGYHRYHLLHHDQMIYQLEAMKQYTYLIEKYYGSQVERYARLVNRNDNQYQEDIRRYLQETIGFYFDKMAGNVIHAMGLNDFYSTMQVLLQMSDRLSMAFSIENRSPFLDYRLVQYAFSLPAHYKIRNGTTKWVLKEVARKFIPAPIVERIDKRGFSAPVNKWFNWDTRGKYDRAFYRKAVFEDWMKAFNVAMH